MYTRENPGCYHRMLDYLSEITGKSRFIEQEFKDISEVDRLTYNTHFILNGEDLGQLQYIFRKGAVKMLTRVIDKTVDISLDTKFDRIYRIINRPLKDFGIEPIKVGKYKDSLGGGWYSTVDLYQVNDKFFAMMECTCM